MARPDAEKKLQINLEYKFIWCIFVLPNNKNIEL